MPKLKQVKGFRRFKSKRQPVVRMDAEKEPTSAVGKEIKAANQASGKKQPVRKPTPMRYPRGIEKQYNVAIQKFIAPLFALTREFLFPQITNIRKQYEEDTRRDSYSTDITQVIEGIEILYYQAHGDDAVEQLVLPFASKTEEFNQAQFGRQAKSILGIVPVIAEPWLTPLRDSWVKQNVSLIKSISSVYFDQIEGIIRRGVESGMTTKNITTEIMQRFGVTRRRARVIARDQIGKYNAHLTMNRSMDLGIVEFIWRTAKDERVRKEDRDNDGKTFTWKSGDNGEYPGTKVQCRCIAENDFSIFF